MKKLINSLNEENFTSLSSSLQSKLLELCLEYRIELSLDKEELKIDLYLKKTKELVAYSWFYLEENYIETGYIDVNEEHQRKGLATTMYEVAQEVSGREIADNNQQTSEGKSFRDKFNRSKS